MEQAIQTTQQVNGIKALTKMLDASSVQKQFANALGEHKNAFIASIVDLCSGDQALQECDSSAIIKECLKAAVLQLPINKALGYSYIVVYKNNVRQPDGSFKRIPTPTFVLGYKGYIQMAMKTGMYKTINADVVYEGEMRKVNRLTGEISFDGERISDKVVGYFCYFELLNGFSKTMYMSVEDMSTYAKKYSPSVRRETTAAALAKKANEFSDTKQVGWEGNFNDMAIKTIIRRLLGKYGYLSIEMQNAMADENIAESNAMDSRTDAVANVGTKVIDTEDAVVVETISPSASAQTAQPIIPQPEY